MTKNQLVSKQSTENGDLPMRRKTVNLSDGLYYFEDELEVKEVLQANVITCTGWLLELIKLNSGEISFLGHEEEIRPNFEVLGIFYPSFTITRPCFKNVKAQLKGIAGIAGLPANIPQRPFVFESEFEKSLKSTADVIEILGSARNKHFVDINPQASLLSVRAKKLIDENYHIFPSIARIAARLKVSHEHLTRQFKRDFGMSPNAYLHQIRIADATFRLMQGEKIIEVSGDVGYNDLSRFYKQFRKSTTKSPGFCQTSKK